jgi:hypothetical protein
MFEKICLHKEIETALLRKKCIVFDSEKNRIVFGSIGISQSKEG